MIDPVVAADGVTYERTAIEDWFGRSGDSPLMGAFAAKSAVRAAVSSLRACLHRGQFYDAELEFVDLRRCHNRT